MNISRIPEYTDQSLDGILAWFATMSKRGLLFHPDDPAETIQDIATAKPIFSPGESGKAQDILDAMFHLHGDEVYEAAYPIFMKSMGLQLDA